MKPFQKSLLLGHMTQCVLLLRNSLEMVLKFRIAFFLVIFHCDSKGEQNEAKAYDMIFDYTSQIISGL